MREKLSIWFSFEFSSADGLVQNVLAMHSFATTTASSIPVFERQCGKWFCGCVVVGGGSTGATAVVEHCRVIASLCPSLPAPSQRGLRGPEHPGGVPEAGLGSSETWALLPGPAWMLAEPTT